MKDKMFHDNKRLRAERNSYICFGCLFLFLVLVQLWVLLKKFILLQKEGELKDSKIVRLQALEKQVKNNQSGAGLMKMVEEQEKSKDKAAG
eukprot:CAMPEP_0181309720 /NCGR_PEP_ID=MMETSP1101-20121128/12169_1 /TAXON_ID=46948 /ORGANISM="Rhodomonas abbreviata, Strain Caron Lab Isolate" /LENGTH=90 /DNA_ID=CAMNT_0023416233 /DNA_START=256 /DNA_END=524 /DNA_ORIENTATION=-